VVGGQWPVEARGRQEGIFVQQFSIFPRFLDGEWGWVSPTLEGIFLMFAKFGEVRGKFFRNESSNFHVEFLLRMFRIG
jgi:hypothetical protein